MPKARPIFNQLNIVSGNVAASIEFYRRLGVEIPQASVWRTQTGVHHASTKDAANENALDLEFDSIAFARIWNAGWSGRDDLRGRMVIGFQVPSRDNVDALYADLTGAGYAGLQAPYDAFWGSRYTVVEDPDGVAVGFMSPVAEEWRSKPPEI